MNSSVDTICALSTPYGRSAIAVIRLSGPSATSIISQMFSGSLQHRMSIPGILRGDGGKTLDEVVVTLFEGPNSYTGEDVVEIGCHGNPKIVEQILSQIVSRGTRLAEPGEFTQRALANGKLSLDQVEALDVILNSTTRAGLEIGLRSKTEGLGRSVANISSLLAEARIGIESQLDFSEAEVGEYDQGLIQKQIQGLIEELTAWSLAYESNRQMFGRWTVALVGRPNSGKSSLFNALIGSNKAIVFDQPGTTRDYLTHEVEINGCPIELVDTAGIRERPDPIEGLGIAKTFEVMKRAEAIVWVDDGGYGPGEEILGSFKDKTWIYVASKSDLSPNPHPKWLKTSSKLGTGVDELAQTLVPRSAEAGAESNWTPLTSNRQYQQVLSGLSHLKAANDLLSSHGFLDQVAQEIRLASDAFRALVDPMANDDLIKSIFSRFCIGK